MKTTSSAPGKLMLYGEHAVVYGYPCIVTAVDTRIHVTVESASTDGIEAPQVGDTRFLEAAVALFRERYGVSSPVMVRTWSEFSHTFGFGSSSAVTVAVLHALMTLFQLSYTKEELFRLAYDTILAVQGLGSGFDVAAAVYGGTIRFQNGQTQILPLHSLPLIVGYTGIKADTATLVNQVRNLKDHDNHIDSLFERIGKLVEGANEYLSDDDLYHAGELMSENHELLKDLGVSIPKLDQMVSAAIKGGAYGAKLSGAGGGDCMIALAGESKRESVIESIINAGGEIIHVTPHAEGVRTQNIV